MNLNAQTNSSLSIAVMQPYLFPYVGYFQLADAVDQFWLFDTANFIRRGWMNRNNILVNGAKKLFTIPVSYGPQDQLILDKSLSEEAIYAFDKLHRLMRHEYSKAPHIERTIELISTVRDYAASRPAPVGFLDVAEFSLKEVFRIIGLNTPIYRVSSLGITEKGDPQERIKDICIKVGADKYVNMAGGKGLYQKEEFHSSGISIYFLEAKFTQYDQGRNQEFRPGLSVLDIISHVPKADIKNIIKDYRLE